MNVDYGKTLDSTIIERGLRSLNPDLHFDLAAAIGQVHPYIMDRQGVYYKGKHICAMDRGPVPEYKIWDVKKTQVPVQWAEADKDDVSIRYHVIPPTHPHYADLYEIARQGKHNELCILSTGKLVRTQCFGYRPWKNRVIRCGWRHTFERLLAAQIPGITRESLGRMFGVDMYKFPVGPPDEVIEAIWAE